jgi:UDP-N-acetylglucosamine transferase subunit ALG13
VIFLTTGTQLPFDRLVRAVDDWADTAQPEGGIAAQVLPAPRAPYVPRNFKTRARLTPAEYDEMFAKADLIVSHAGMGTILTALTNGKRICIMPRQVQFGEHRNDHQLATVERLGTHPGLFKARDADALPACLDAAMQAGGDTAQARLDRFAPEGFTSRLRDFILSGQG